MKKTYIILFGLLLNIGLTQNIVAAAAPEDVEEQEDLWKQELARRQQEARTVMQNLTPEQKELGEQLVKAASKGEVEKVESLVAQGAPLNFQNNYQQTALLLLATDKFTYTEKTQKTIHILLSAGTDVNITDNDDHTPLIACVRNEKVNVDLIELLLKMGAISSINTQTSDDDFTALMYAASKRNSNTVRLLLKARANASLNYQNSSGDTALMEAIRYNNHETVQLLIFAGANLNIKNKYNETALTLQIYDINNENAEKKRLYMTSFIEDALKEKKRSPHVPAALAQQLPFLPTPLIEIILDCEQDPILRDQQRLHSQAQTPK